MNGQRAARLDAWQPELVAHVRKLLFVPFGAILGIYDFLA